MAALVPFLLAVLLIGSPMLVVQTGPRNPVTTFDGLSWWMWHPARDPMLRLLGASWVGFAVTTPPAWLFAVLFGLGDAPTAVTRAVALALTLWPVEGLAVNLVLAVATALWARRHLVADARGLRVLARWPARSVAWTWSEIDDLAARGRHLAIVGPRRIDLQLPPGSEATVRALFAAWGAGRPALEQAPPPEALRVLLRAHGREPT